MAIDYIGKDMFEETLMVHGWPECGPGSISVEAMYQVFKARLMRELVAGLPSVPIDQDGARTLCSPLVDKP